MSARRGTTLRVAIVDDEEPARAVLRQYLAGRPGVEIVAECRNGFEAVEAVETLSPDLLFLDVQMPGLSGFDVLELIGREVAVVFVTAYEEHAVHAFDVHAVDYLLKPFSGERLGQALERARGRVGRPRDPGPDRAAAAAMAAGARPSRLLVREGARVHVIPFETLELAEARDDYVCLRAGGREFLKQQTLTELEGQLDREAFVRVHRSFIVNVGSVVRLERYSKDGRLAVLAGGRKIPVSRNGLVRLRGLLGGRSAGL